MPLPPPVSHKESTETVPQNVHPYVIKLDVKIRRIKHSLNNIFEIADSDLIVSDAKTGLNDFSINHQFADQLDNLSKVFNKVAEKITKKASKIRDKIEEAVETKRAIQPVHFLEEITDHDKKLDEAKRKLPHEIRPYRYSHDFRIKRETLDSSDICLRH